MSIDVRKLTEKYGKPLSAMLSIDLGKGDLAYSKWLLASILYSRPLPEETSIEAYEILERRGQTSPGSIVEAGRDQLVIVLEKSGYSRYDLAIATEAIEAFSDLLKRYDGKLSRLYDMSTDSKDLERRIGGLGKGLGPVAVSVFLRDMRTVWPKADPGPAPKVKELMSSLGIEDLKEYSKEQGIDLVRLETALCRYTRDQIVHERASTDRKWRDRYRPHPMR